MKRALCLAILFTSALWADEAADRNAVEATIAALNATPSRTDIFTADFSDAAELRRIRDENRLSPTLVISREPMGEATWSPGAVATFVTRLVTFVSQNTAVVVASYQQQSVIFVVKSENSAWRIASFQVIPEGQTKVR